jgi:hypothetical protein
MYEKISYISLKLPENKLVISLMTSSDDFAEIAIQKIITLEMMIAKRIYIKNIEVFRLSF